MSAVYGIPFGPSVDDTADDRYDEYVARVDSGLECPDCHTRRGIVHEQAMGLPLFVCICSARWFDMHTRPTQEAAADASR